MNTPQNSTNDSNTFDRPFPALAPAERLFLEVNGYVVIPEVLSRDECETVLEALQKLKRDLEATGSVKNFVRGATGHPLGTHYLGLGNILNADPAITAYATHPRLVGMAEELIGGEARLVEFNAIVNSRDPATDLSQPPRFAFHTGMDVPYGAHTKNGLYHCIFVKTLTNLTDMGPDDGGTVVIAGSHKLDLSSHELAEMAYTRPDLVHQVIAPAGSTLLFSETLIHATNQIRSDNERTIIIAGYGGRQLPMWEGNPTPEFLESVPPHLQTLFHGKSHWARGARYRNISDPVDTRSFTLADGWHAPARSD